MSAGIRQREFHISFIMVVTVTQVRGLLFILAEEGGK